MPAVCLRQFGNRVNNVHFVKLLFGIWNIMVVLLRKEIKVNLCSFLTPSDFSHSSMLESLVPLVTNLCYYQIESCVNELPWLWCDMIGLDTSCDECRMVSKPDFLCHQSSPLSVYRISHHQDKKSPNLKTNGFIPS